MAQFTVKPGGTLTIGIRGDAQQQREQGSATRFIGVESSEDNYVFRKQGRLAIFDLGTRLRAHPTGTVYNGLELREYGATDTPEPGDDLQHEYVECRYEAAGSSIVGFEPPGAPNILVSDLEFLRLRRVLMGSLAPPVDGEPDDPLNPLGFSLVNTAGVPRKVAHCMPLYHGKIGDSFTLGSFAANLFPIRINGIPLTNLVADGRALMREPKPTDADERWCADNKDSGAAFGQIEFTKAYASSLKGGRIRIEDIGSAGISVFFFAFDTNDTDNVKITREPFFAADEVTYAFSGHDAFYLRPRLGGLKRSRVVSGVTRVVASWVGRRYPNTGTIIPVIHNVQPLPARNWVRRSLYSQYPAEATAQTANHGYSAGSEPSVSDELLEGDLIAIISRAGKPFYLWRKR